MSDLELIFRHKEVLCIKQANLVPVNRHFREKMSRWSIST